MLQKCCITGEYITTHIYHLISYGYFYISSLVYTNDLSNRIIYKYVYLKYIKFSFKLKNNVDDAFIHHPRFEKEQQLILYEFLS